MNPIGFSRWVRQNLESNHNTLEEIKDKIRQIDELSAKIKQLQDECGINTPNS